MSLKTRPLGLDTDPMPYWSEMIANDFFSQYADTAFVALAQSFDTLEQSRLSCTVRSDDAKDLTSRDTKRYVIDRRNPTVHFSEMYHIEYRIVTHRHVTPGYTRYAHSTFLRTSASVHARSAP